MTEEQIADKVRGCAEFAQWPADRTERIIEMAQRGTTDQHELVAGATRFITTNYRLKTISPDIPVRPGLAG